MTERTPERFRPASWIFQRLLRLLFRSGYGMWVEGLEHVPAEGGCILASSHESFLALRAGVPVVPAAVFHTKAAMRRKMVPGGRAFGIRFGPPIPVARETEPGRARLFEVRDLIMAGIAAQLELGAPAVPGIPKEAP